MSVALKMYPESLQEGLQQSLLQGLVNNNNDHDNNNLITKLEKKIELLQTYIDKRNVIKEQSMQEKKVQAMQEWFDRKEAAEYLGVAVRTIADYIRRGELVGTWGPAPKGKKRMFSREELDSLQNAKHEDVQANFEQSEPVDNSEVYEVEKISPPAPVPVYDISRNIMQEVEQKIDTALQQQQKYFSDIIAKLQEDNTRLVNELREKQERDAEHLRGRVSRVDEFIEEYRREQKLGVWAKIKARLFGR